VSEVFCLDAGVLVKYLVEEDPPEDTAAAGRLMRRTVATGQLVAPAFAWAEVGSVLRKKVRQGSLRQVRSEELWAEFHQLPIEFVELAVIRDRAWEIANQPALPTLYDAAYLACTELSPAEEPATREFWTADEFLIRQLGVNCPSYIRRLSEA